MRPARVAGRLRPTRRGWLVVLVVVAAVGSGALFGARGLNAIAAPGVVALAYAALQVRRLDPPSVGRRLPRHGEQGTRARVTLHVEAERPFSARLVDAVDDGLDAAGNDRAVTLGDGPVTYDVALVERGDRTLGPAVIRARDVLGLVERPFEVEETSRLRVRPPVYPLSGPRADELVWIFGGSGDRQEFDFLRHYRRGDPLRDIHWRSSAKLPGEALVVKQFSTDEGVTSVRLAAESAVDHADEMAAAAASLATHLLLAGFRVGLDTADQHLEPRAGSDQREAVLDALALTRGGPVANVDRDRADVVVRAGPGGVKVELDVGTVGFVEVAGRPVTLPDRAGANGWRTAEGPA